MLISESPAALLALLVWAILWLSGGIALAAAVFRLRPNEQLVVGIATGWLAQNWLANLLSLALPVPVGFWLSAGVVFLAGFVAVLRGGWKPLLAMRVSPLQVLVLVAVTLIFFSIARGVAIFDDFQHLPAASLIAAGDFPPRFVLDPKVVFGYHHFLLLFAAQMIRIGGLAPWTAVDAARALSFGLAVMLSALFSQRLTRSLAGGFLGGLMVAFGSGARWLLLLAPPTVTVWLSRSVHLIGSGAGSGENLHAALLNAWAVEGAGPLPFPFAFANGIFPAGVISAHTANGLTGFVVIFLLLLTFNRWRSAMGAVLSAIFLSIWGLLGEAELPLIAAGWGLVAAAWAVTHRSLRLPRSLWAWLGVAAAGCVIGVLEGGAWTDLLLKTAARAAGQAGEASYQTVGFQAAFPPVIVSSHLGVLPILNPATLFVALCELGPVLLVLPLLAAWGIKAYRMRRWYEAAVVATAFIALLTVFVQFSGSTGVRNTPRLYVFMPLLAAFAVPLFWMWAERRSQVVKALVAGLGLVAMLGGIVMGGIELLATQRPVYSYFLTPLDARMMRAHWNALEPGALVFDPVPYRAPAIFGRHTDSNLTWYQAKPAWEALYQSPDPLKLRAAGFQYLYVDNTYWDAMPAQYQDALENGCARLIDTVSGDQGTFRRLYDLAACR